MALTLLFVRTKSCVVNEFVWAQFQGQQVCFCNWNKLTGPPAGITAFTGAPSTWFNQLTAAGILFCPSEKTKVVRILLNNSLTDWTVV
jgi:hypothetical protein